MERIVLVEDNPDWLELATSELQKEWPACEVDSVTTESQFMERFKSWERDPPDVFIMDIMIPWADPARDMPKPPNEVQEHGFARAGLRCHSRLTANERLQKVPVVFWTIVELTDLRREAGVTRSMICVRKEEHLAGLLRRVREVLPAPHGLGIEM